MEIIQEKFWDGKLSGTAIRKLNKVNKKKV